LLEIQARKFKERLARISVVVGDSSGGHPSDLAIDPTRIEQEMALLLERSDISEELTRLSSHVEQMVAYMADDESQAGRRPSRVIQPLGRRLDFLLQEMAREINTIGAKSQDLRIAHLVIELKAEIERMREQVQNVE
jgi:uncharacterized protein (TIGR00255 family)